MPKKCCQLQQYYLRNQARPRGMVEILARSEVPARLDAKGILEPGQSQGQGFQQRPRGNGLIPIMPYLSIKKMNINPGFYHEN